MSFKASRGFILLCTNASIIKNKTAHGSSYYLLLIISSLRRYFSVKHYKEGIIAAAAAAIRCDLSLTSCCPSTSKGRDVFLALFTSQLIV